MAVASAQAGGLRSLPYPILTTLPSPVASPPTASDSPWTPTVKSLLHQLEPAQPDPETDARPAAGTTMAQLMNADTLLRGTNFSTCTNVGANAAPTGTNPVISPLCWSDALGVNVTAGAQVRQTTAPPLRIAMSSSWDPQLLNAWGQVEGTEGRWLGVTGIYGPQSDLLRLPDWGRNLTVLGEDPFEDGTMSAAETNGIQGKGLMSQIKHFAMYDGQIMDLDSEVQDQAAHQMYLQPYEYGTSGSGVLPGAGQASSMMCSYARYEIVPAPGISGGVPSELSPTGGALSCDNPIKNYVAHQEWRWPGFFASDYLFGMDSTVQAFESGTDQEMPNDVFFGAPLVAAVEAGAVPLSTFNLALARILYQEERFHLLGHADASSNYLSPSNPTTSDGKYAITQSQKSADGALVERASEEGAVLLKNAKRTLPLTKSDLKKGVLVVGDTAEYMPADPGTEQANGYPDRDAISPLEQLQQFAPKDSRITFSPWMPGSAPTISDGEPVPQSELSTDGTTAGNGLQQTSGPGSPKVVPELDFTSVSRRGQLAFGQTYSWTGYVDVPAADSYTFRFQFSVPSLSIETGGDNMTGQVTPPACTGPGAPTFSLASSAGTGQSMSNESLNAAPSTLTAIPTDPTMSGYTERGLANCYYSAGALSAGMHQISISWASPSSFSSDTYHLREPGSTLPSFRFAYSRATGDQADAVALAKQASKVIVFADCTCVKETTTITGDANSLDAGPTQLIQAMTAANPNTIVVANWDVATLMPWISSVKSLLQMWYPGGEGGTATARLLLGSADPSGHLTQTWPKNSTDTIFGYNETTPLYPGDTTGTHPERLAGTPTSAGPFIDWTEGLYVGYRFFDKEGLAPLFPFGWGLSYTTFRYSRLTVRRARGGLNVSFSVTNTGKRTGTAVPQVYLGPAPTAPTGVQQAFRSLAGFDRVTLRPHKTVSLTIHIGPGPDLNGYGDTRAFEYWYTAKQEWQTAAGARQIWVGSADAAADLPLRQFGISKPHHNRRKHHSGRAGTKPSHPK